MTKPPRCLFQMDNSSICWSTYKWLGCMLCTANIGNHAPWRGRQDDGLLPSQLISKNRLKYLGHILRHPTCIEHHLCFNSSLSLRTISSPFRRGAPRTHWPELALAESQYRLSCRRNNSVTSPGDYHHRFHQHFTFPDLKNWTRLSMPYWKNTGRQMHQFLPLAENREYWKK